MALDLNQWIAHRAGDGQPTRDLRDQLSGLQPYHQIEWVGWPENGKQQVVLRPHQAEYVRFTFCDPVSYTRGHSTHPDYLGIAATQQQPKLTRRYMEPHEFFQRKSGETSLAVMLPSEFGTGQLKLALTAGRRRVGISPGLIQNVKTVREGDWLQKPVVDIYHSRDLVLPASDPW